MRGAFPFFVRVACIVSADRCLACADPLDCYGRVCGFEQPPGIPHPLGWPDGIPDDQQCITDWDGDGWILPSDVASYTASWFFRAQNPWQGCSDVDLDCDGATTPADLAIFIQYWLANVRSGHCP